ncbi:MAG: Obg family GTPase CgtA, partial [bacterium]
AGHGGRGAVSFSSAKNTQGPTGGSGGDGGGIYFEGIADLTALGQFHAKKEIFAENGADGQPRLKDGATGRDCILKIPQGTVIHYEDGTEREILNAGERVLIVKGGKGGKGNFLFRSSRNTTPKQFQLGLPGEHLSIRLELKYIADVGFIGLPNVGKSSLLNELTNTKSKVANYPFTTLEPNLGIYYGLVLADIPGLIEGASAGKGLGIKFLRHIERTKVLFHFISSESEDPARDYKIIRNELGEYNKALLKKPEYIFLTKSDLADENRISEILKKIKSFAAVPAGDCGGECGAVLDRECSRKRIKSSVAAISVYDDESLKPIKKILNGMGEKK